MGVTYLLDTHALIWLTSARRAKPRRVVEALERDDAVAVVSAVTAFEIATKVRLGKLEQARALGTGWEALVPEFGTRTVPLEDRHALLAGRLDWDHRDPFDRLLAAQALVEGFTLVTADPVFDRVSGLSLLRW